MTEPLERRYRILLIAYPPAYRAHRADEMLATLLDCAAPDRRWPAPREAVALALGGLRARVGAHRQRSTVDVWLGGLRIAALVLLAQAVAVAGADAGLILANLLAGRDRQSVVDLPAPITTGFALAALLLVARGRYATGLAVALPGLVANHFLMSYSTGYLSLDAWGILPPDLEYWPLPVAVLMLLPLLRWPPPSGRRSWLWLLAVPGALVLLPTPYDATLRIQPWALGAVVLACLMWTVVDARAAVTGAALVLCLTLYFTAIGVDSGGYQWYLPQLIGSLVTIALLLAAVALRAPRQARP
jgi:hypothetical protein